MISIVICSITPANLQAARRNLSALLADEPHEFISITDAKSLAEGYNRGVRQARGELLVLCHDDIEVISPDFRQILLSRLQRFDLIGVAGATQLKGPRWLQAGPPHIFGQIAHYIQTEQAYDVVVWSVPARAIPGICVMDGVFLAGKRKVFENVQFDEQTFDGFHLYDLDFTFRAARSGFRLGVCTDLAIIHASIGSYDQAWERSAARFSDKHQKSFTYGASHYWQAMGVRVRCKEHVYEIMRPRDWSAADVQGELVGAAR
jgi:GT2 family glycosyltransferase